MKTIFVVTITILCSGCMYQSITAPEVEIGTTICAVQEQLPPKSFESDAIGGEWVTCYNGAGYQITKRNLTKQ